VAFRSFAKQGRPAMRAHEIRGPAPGTLLAKVTVAVSKEQYVNAQF
jgi:hypothetical protein